MKNQFNKIINIIKQHKTKLIILIGLIFLIIIISQIFVYYNKYSTLQKSIDYYNSVKNKTPTEINEQMISISNDDDFYSLLASMEIINSEFNNKNYFETYDKYILLLNKKNINNLYKTLIAIHASYNLLDFLDTDKINDLLFYIDDSLETFQGFKKEILFILAFKNNSSEIDKLYNEIINNVQISSSIKSRVKKIYEFEQYN